MTGIVADSLTKTFGDLTAVEAVDLTVDDGEFLVLVGPSGCGKSTFLRLIAGLETPSDGELRLAGDLMNGVGPGDRDIAIVFQNYALYPHMSAERNMSFGAKSASGLTSTEIDERVETAAETLDIADLLDRRPGELSGGEKQRVAMGRALVRDPSVMLLDEPLSNLDAKLRDRMRAELVRLHRELDTTTVYVTHDQTEAMTLGDRIAVMNDGTLEQVAPPQELYDHPETSFVARFIGSPKMNLVSARIASGDAGYTAVAGDIEIPLGDVPAMRNHDGRRVELGVRPEDLSLAPDGSGDFGADVTMTEPLGSRTIVYATVDGTEIAVETDPRRELSVGDRVRVDADPNRLHLFDSDTGRALYHSAGEEASPEPTEAVPVTEPRQ